MFRPSYVCKIEFNDFYLQIKGMTMGKRICPRQQVFYCMPTVRKLPIVFFSMSLNSIEKLFL